MLTKLEGARIFSNGTVINHTIPYLTPNWAVRRYGSGYQVNDPRGVGHVGVIGEIQQDALNKRLTTGTMPAKAQAVLTAFGLTGAIENLDWSDLHFLRSTNGFSAMRIILDDIRAQQPDVEGPPPTGETPDFLEYPGMPPLLKTPGGPDTVYERLALYGMIVASTDYSEQKFYAVRYYNNKLVPNVNEEQWMADERGLRPLPEEWAPTEDGIYLYDQLECRIAEWGMLLSEGETEVQDFQKAAKDAYWAFEKSFVPAIGAGAPAAFGDRRVNPRSVLNAGRKLENAIVQGKPDFAAWCGPRCAFTLGVPQHMSRYEQWGFSSQPLQSRDWRGVLGIGWSEGDTGNEFPGGPT